MVECLGKKPFWPGLYAKLGGKTKLRPIEGDSESDSGPGDIAEPLSMIGIVWSSD